MFKNIKHIHFVGIGGSGMSGIAEVLLHLGYRVTGSDLQKNAESKRLEERGATVWQGHAAKNIGGADVVVTSTAVSKTNPEVQAAHKAGIPVIPRVEMLAELARLKYTVAIAGTHGKTTTTSYVAQIFQQNNLDPTVIVGGRLKALGTGGVLGKGDFLIAEADESDGSFLKLAPTISVVTNIDNDHLDYYKTEQKLLDAFVAFVEKTPFYGITFLCGDDKGVKKILPRLSRRMATYGFSKGCDIQAVEVSTHYSGTTFGVIHKGKNLGAMTLQLTGRHNILNALAATAIGLHVHLTLDQIAGALNRFEGVGRRMETKGETNGILVVDDYGHHPTEMAATITALQERWTARRLVVCFQPHRYSRTQLLARQFGAVLSKVDKLYLFPIYPAGEKPIKGVTTELIAKAIKKKNWSWWNPKTGLRDLHKELKAGDILLTLGAGNVWKVGEDLLKEEDSLGNRIGSVIPSLNRRIKREEPLSRHCTWGIGGPAEAYIDVHTLEELKKIQKYCLDQKVPFFILGWGSNILLPDEGLRGVVARLRGEFEAIQFDGEQVQVGGGVHLPKLAKRCAEKKLTGVEPLAGVPGTIGGALMTNAGTPRGEIGDVVQSVEVLNADGSTTTLSRNDIEWHYRHTSLEGKWVVGARLGLKFSSNGDVHEKIKAELAYREKTQPLGTKNVGSVFRNPEGDHAARLIEAVGLKGKAVGRVRFSPKHANFIENTGGATAKEAQNLIQQAQTLVQEKFQIILHPEVKIIKP